MSQTELSSSQRKSWSRLNFLRSIRIVLGCRGTRTRRSDRNDSSASTRSDLKVAIALCSSLPRMMIDLRVKEHQFRTIWASRAFYLKKAIWPKNPQLLVGANALFSMGENTCLLYASQPASHVAAPTSCELPLQVSGLTWSRPVTPDESR